MQAVRYDTEDLDTTKCKVDIRRLMTIGTYKFNIGDGAGLQEAWLKLQQLPVKYPKLGMSAMSPSMVLHFMTMLAQLAINAHDLATAHELMGKTLNPMMWLSSISGGNGESVQMQI